MSNEIKEFERVKGMRNSSSSLKNELTMFSPSCFRNFIVLASTNFLLERKISGSFMISKP